jgi:hypothetical protein
MFVAKEALQNEIQTIMRQVDKSNLEKDELVRTNKFFEQTILEQEKQITFWKIFAMNGDFSKGVPIYLDDALDYGTDAVM